MVFHTFDRARPKIMVVSHERSGTHFLMNSIAKCYGYLAAPWINFDYELGLNFFHPPTLADFFAQFRNCHLANIVKSHHAFAFFESVFDAIASDFHVFYVYRDPRDTMISYWNFIRQLPWHEGPKTETCAEFIRAEPCGQMGRYQYRQEKTVIHRWLAHVDGWTLGAPALSQRVTFVRFRDLAFDYENVMQSFAPVFGERPLALERPSVQENSVLPGTGKVGTYKHYLDASDLRLFQDVAGRTMQRLGFEGL